MILKVVEGNGMLPMAVDMEVIGFVVPEVGDPGFDAVGSDVFEAKFVVVIELGKGVNAEDDNRAALGGELDDVKDWRAVPVISAIVEPVEEAESSIKDNIEFVDELATAPEESIRLEAVVLDDN